MGTAVAVGVSVGVGVSDGVAVGVFVWVGGGVNVGGTVSVGKGVQVAVGKGIVVLLGTIVGNGSVATAAKAIALSSILESVVVACRQLLPNTISSKLIAKNKRFIMLQSRFPPAIVAEVETAVK